MSGDDTARDPVTTRSRLARPWLVVAGVIALLAVPAARAVARGFVAGGAAKASPVCTRTALRVPGRLTITARAGASPAVDVTVRAPSGAALDAVLRYWSTPGREAAVRAALLRAVDGPVPLRDLLPPLPQRWLSDARGDVVDDATTAVSFFAPQPVVTTRASLVEALQRGYVPVPPHDMRFGDVVVLYDVARRPVWCANHLADDLVFTRASTPGAPWAVVPFRALRAAHPDAVTVLLWRRADAR